MSERRFAAMILTHGRPDKVMTYNTLRRSGYSGRILLVVDDQDKSAKAYRRAYGGEVVSFSKSEIAKRFDTGDNFSDMRTIVYARNACFDIAEACGLSHFLELDDDYHWFEYRFTDKLEPALSRDGHTPALNNLDSVFDAFLGFLDDSPAMAVAMAQAGDFIAGLDNRRWKRVSCMRKAMNSFFCRTDRRFDFIGRINEDVNTYTRAASTGLLVFSTSQVSLCQADTQSSKGGMTDVYLDSGTYVKSFYSVMYHPSSVSVRMMGDRHKRLHHSVSWRHTVPKILSESLKK